MGIEKVGVEFMESGPEVDAKQGGSEDGAHHGVVVVGADLFEPGVDHAHHQGEVEVNQKVDVVGDVGEAKNQEVGGGEDQEGKKLAPGYAGADEDGD